MFLESIIATKSTQKISDDIILLGLLEIHTKNSHEQMYRKNILFISLYFLFLYIKIFIYLFSYLLTYNQVEGL